MTESPYLLLRGVAAPPAELVELRAGPLQVLLDGIDLRYARIGDSEVVRRVYAAVRDAQWDTVPGEVERLEVEQRDDGFEVHFRVRHVSEHLDFSWSGTITGEADGTLVYILDGRAERDIAYNRIGLCVHHPWRQTAGGRFRARSPQGEVEGVFPDLIGPQRVDEEGYHALFSAFDRLEVEPTSGGSVLFEFEGDLWEIEDQRNWTDASFKSYSTPISDPTPHRLGAGEALRQRVTLRAAGIPPLVSSAVPLRLRLGRTVGRRVPPIGIGSDRVARCLSDVEAALVAGARPAHLRVDIHPDRSDWRTTVQVALENARRVGTLLEASLHVHAGEGQLPEIASLLGASGRVARVLVIPAEGRTGTPLETTPSSLFDEVRAVLGRALPDAEFVGGTEMFFTELNRRRPEADGWDGLCFGVTPQVHAFDDIDLVESLEAQAENVRSARAFCGEAKVVVSSVTLKPRLNFFAADPDPAVPSGAMEASADLRQPSLLGAAWTVGSLKYLSEAGADSVTYFETTGWRGILQPEVRGRAPQPHWPPCHVFPLYHPLADVAGWIGGEVIPVDSTDPLAVVALAVRAGSGLHMLVANLTATTRSVIVERVEGRVALRRLNAHTADEAASEPATFRATGAHVDVQGALPLQLEPYEVVRLDSA